MQRFKVLALAGLATILLLLGTAVPVVADDDTPPPPAERQNGFLDRVAGILGKPKEEVIAAFKQAREELKGVAPSPTPEAPRARLDALLERVAQILGITEEQLVSAFREAATELRNERLNAALQKAVEKGLITQEEKEQIETWFDSRPPVVDKFLNFGFFRGKGLGHHRRLLRGELGSHRAMPQNHPTVSGLPRTGNYTGNVY